MDDIVDLGQGAMFVGLSEPYNFAALDALLTTLEQAGADQDHDLVLDLVTFQSPVRTSSSTTKEKRS